MTDTGSDDSIPIPQHWDRWPMLLMERIRLPYSWIIVLMAVLGIISVGLDTAFRYRWRGVWPASDVSFGVTSIVVAVYILAYMRLIKRASGRALAKLRRFVQISDAEFESYVHRFLHARGRVEVLLLCMALLLMIVFLVVPPDQLRRLPLRAPIEAAGLVVIALYWALLFYLLLSLVYVSIRNAARPGRSGEATVGDQCL